MRTKAGLALLAAAAAAGCGGSGVPGSAPPAAHPHATSTSIPPQTFVALPTTAPITDPLIRPLRAGPVAVTVHGTGNGTVTIRYDSNDESDPIVPLPHTYHVAVPDEYGLYVEVDGTGQVGCSIVIPGKGQWVDQGDSNAYCNTLSDPVIGNSVSAAFRGPAPGGATGARRA